MTRHRVGPIAHEDTYDGDPRFASVTVNRSTTRYLKLMLLTLAEQQELGLVRRIVIVDNASRDHAGSFLAALAAAVPRVIVAENRHFLNHARGIRTGLRALERAERDETPGTRTNLMLFCDPDVIFRNPETILTLASVITVHDAAFAGELRQSSRRFPDAQASFVALRRDWMARREIAPWVNHGSPCLWMQESIWRTGGVVVEFPSNNGGYILHRGRSAVAAAREYTPRSSYATAATNTPHFMDVPEGSQIWAEVEDHWSPLLAPEREDELVAHLAERFRFR